MLMRPTATALALVFAAAATPQLASAQDNEVVELADYGYDALYEDGVSALEVIEEMDAISETGEDIGQIEDLIVSEDGSIVAVTAELGGFLDIGDTHVSVPWSAVEMSADGIMLPVTDENINDFTIFNTDYLPMDTAESEVVQQVDDAEIGTSTYRVSEIIGDYARLGGEADAPMNYGYVRDVIIRDDMVEAVVVNPDVTYGTPGYRAYPYYGVGYGYNPYGPYYDMPYSDAEAREMEAFDYERMGTS